MKKFGITCNTSIDGTKWIEIEAEKREDITHEMIMDKLLEELKLSDFEIGSCNTYSNESYIEPYEEGEKKIVIEGVHTIIKIEKLRKLKEKIEDLKNVIRDSRTDKTYDIG